MNEFVVLKFDVIDVWLRYSLISDLLRVNNMVLVMVDI